MCIQYVVIDLWSHVHVHTTHNIIYYSCTCINIFSTNSVESVSCETIMMNLWLWISSSYSPLTANSWFFLPIHTIKMANCVFTCIYILSVCYVLFVWSVCYLYLALSGLLFSPSFVLLITSRVSYRIFGGGGRSLWGTATVSCMSMRLQILSMKLYKFQDFWVGKIEVGGKIPGLTTLCMKPRPVYFLFTFTAMYDCLGLWILQRGVSPSFFSFPYY